MNARNIRISLEMRNRLHATADSLQVDVCEVVRRALRKSRNDSNPVVCAPETPDTTMRYSLRLVDLRDVAEYAKDMTAADIRHAINTYVPLLPMVQHAAPDTEPGWTLTEDGTAIKKEA